MWKHKEANQGETHWAVTLVCSSMVTILRQEKNLFQKRFWINLYDLFFLTQLSLLHTEYATKWLFLRLRANQGQVLSWCSSKTSKKFKKTMSVSWQCLFNVNLNTCDDGSRSIRFLKKSVLGKVVSWLTLWSASYLLIIKIWFVEKCNLNVK